MKLRVRVKPGGSHSERQATVFSPSALAEPIDLAFGARLQLVFGRCRAGIQLGELEALEQLRPSRSAAATSTAGRCRGPGAARSRSDAGRAESPQGPLPGGRRHGIRRPGAGRTRKPAGRDRTCAPAASWASGQLVGKAAADALGAPVDPDHFLARAVELEQALANRTIALHAMPDLMGGEAAIALVDEGALETVLAIGLGEDDSASRKRRQPEWREPPSGCQAQQQGGGAHVSPQRFSRLAAQSVGQRALCTADGGLLHVLTQVDRQTLLMPAGIAGRGVGDHLRRPCSSL